MQLLGFRDESKGSLTDLRTTHPGNGHGGREGQKSRHELGRGVSVPVG